VISVGNLTVGGTGKTPFVQFLIKELKANFPDFHFTILSRGYKAEFSSVGAKVESTSNPKHVGDEPLLHKNKFPDVQVLIGSRRYESFLKFNQIKDKKHIVILDDGFQHHKLKRNLDIVLLDANHPLGNGFTIPIGTLRETSKALLRSDVIVYTKLNETNQVLAQSINQRISKFATHIPVFFSGLNSSLRVLIPKVDTIDQYFLITGVGNPNSVLHSAEKILNQKISGYKFFSDHKQYTESEMKRVLNELKPKTCLLVTEKDWIKLKELEVFLSKLKEKKIGLAIIEIEIDMQNLDSFRKFIVSHVSSYAKENDLV